MPSKITLSNNAQMQNSDGFQLEPGDLLFVSDTEAFIHKEIYLIVGDQGRICVLNLKTMRLLAKGYQLVGKFESIECFLFRSEIINDFKSSVAGDERELFVDLIRTSNYELDIKRSNYATHHFIYNSALNQITSDDHCDGTITIKI